MKLTRFAIVLIALGSMLTAIAPSARAAESGSMLYLVEFQASSAGAPTSREQTIDLLDKLIVPSLEALSKDGRIMGGGILVGARAGAFVLSAKSNEEVTAIVRVLPAWGVWEWKVTPLESFASRAALEKKNLQQMRGQK